jgi:hypothetical protein
VSKPKNDERNPNSFSVVAYLMPGWGYCQQWGEIAALGLNKRNFSEKKAAILSCQESSLSRQPDASPPAPCDRYRSVLAGSHEAPRRCTQVWGTESGLLAVWGLEVFPSISFSSFSPLLKSCGRLTMKGKPDLARKIVIDKGNDVMLKLFHATTSSEDRRRTPQKIQARGCPRRDRNVRAYPKMDRVLCGEDRKETEVKITAWSGPGSCTNSNRTLSKHPERRTHA